MTAVAFGITANQLRRVDLARLISDADGAAMGASALLSLIPLVGAAYALIIISPVRLPAVPTIAAQTATSFANILTPANAGGIALLARFVHRRRVPTSRSLATVAFVQAASVLCMTGAAVVSLVVTGRRIDLSESASLPALAAAGAVAAVLGGVALWVGYRRGRHYAERILRALREAWQQTRELLHQPLRVAGVLGVSLVILAGSTLTLSSCVTAYGGHAPLASVVLVLTAGTVIGTATPVPGGIGATETSLAAGLTVAGVDPLAAVGAAVMYRLLIFWIRVPLGWGCLIWLRRAGHM